MVINKFGDVSLLLAMIILWKVFGSWDYSVIFSNCGNEKDIILLNLCNFLLLLGVIGKSAQIGLHT